MRVRIRELLAAASSASLAVHAPRPASAVAHGWVRSVRKQKSVAFMHIDDGSSAQGLQVVLKAKSTAGFGAASEITTGASVAVTGTLSESRGAGQALELHAESVRLHGASDAAYPLQKKKHTPEFLRSVPHLRPRTRACGAVTRVRSELALATHAFLGGERGLAHVHTPCITTSDAEGGGQLFGLTAPSEAEEDAQPYFGRPAHLTVSGQLCAEALACGVGDVYTFGPCFRAESSNTRRHVSELWMVEPELAWAELGDAAELAEDYIRHCLRHATDADDCRADLELLSELNGVDCIGDIEKCTAQDRWAHVSYTEAVELLTQSGALLINGPPRWGEELGTEHERFLADSVFSGAPVVVTDYPAAGKPFYMRRNGDGRTAAAFDVIFPRIAELAGGGQREEREDELLANIRADGMDEQQYAWYTELRRWGTVPHAGFGLGFDRLVQFTAGVSNIRDAVSFPRTPGSALC